MSLHEGKTLLEALQSACGRQLRRTEHKAASDCARIANTLERVVEDIEDIAREINALNDRQERVSSAIRTEFLKLGLTVAAGALVPARTIAQRARAVGKLLREARKIKQQLDSRAPGDIIPIDRVQIASILIGVVAGVETVQILSLFRESNNIENEIQQLSDRLDNLIGEQLALVRLYNAGSCGDPDTALIT